MSSSESTVPESTVQRLNGFEVSSLLSAWQAVNRHRVSIACLLSAAIVMVAAIACTTIQVRDSVFDAFQLQVLVALLSSIAFSHVLVAFGVRSERWHLWSWFAVAAGWFLCLFVT